MTTPCEADPDLWHPDGTSSSATSAAKEAAYRPAVTACIAWRRAALPNSARFAYMAKIAWVRVQEIDDEIRAEMQANANARASILDGECVLAAVVDGRLDTIPEEMIIGTAV